MGQLKVTSRLVLGTQAEVLLEGTVDFRTFEELHKYLLRVLAEHPETIRIDMRNVTYLSSVGVWTLIDGGGGYVVNDVAVDPNCASRVYWAKGFVARRQQHRGGIMVTHNNGATITNITAGSSFHNAPVADVEVDRFNKHYVYAASYGQGFWFYDWGDPMPGCGI